MNKSLGLEQEIESLRRANSDLQQWKDHLMRRILQGGNIGPLPPSSSRPTLPISSLPLLPRPPPSSAISLAQTSGLPSGIPRLSASGIIQPSPAWSYTVGQTISIPSRPSTTRKMHPKKKKKKKEKKEMKKPKKSKTKSAPVSSRQKSPRKKEESTEEEEREEETKRTTTETTRAGQPPSEKEEMSSDFDEESQSETEEDERETGMYGMDGTLQGGHEVSIFANVTKEEVKY